MNPYQKFLYQQQCLMQGELILTDGLTGTINLHSQPEIHDNTNSMLMTDKEFMQHAYGHVKPRIDKSKVYSSSKMSNKYPDSISNQSNKQWLLVEPELSRSS